MSAEKNQKPVSSTEKKSTTQEVDVLYQRMGDTWYAFSVIDDEVFFGEVSPELVPGNELKQGL